MSDHPVTREQGDRAFNYAFGHPMREADWQILQVVGPTTTSLAEYMWDHWMGEPDEPTQEQVQERIESVLGFGDSRRNK